jgi:hypothetical protein
MLFAKGFIHGQSVSSYSANEYDNYSSDVEVAFDGGRIDIFLKRIHGKDPFAIIIETKVYASDQPQQLERYWSYLERIKSIEDSRKLLLYLTPSGKNPSRNSISETKEKELRKIGVLHNISYNSDIKKWLEGVLPKVRSLKIQYLIKQYIEVVLAL